MLKEILLASTVLSNYARAVYAAANSPTYQLGLSTHEDFIDDKISQISQISIGNSGTVSSQELSQVAQIFTPPIPIFDKPSGGGSCDTTDIFFTSTGVGTWTAISGCGHVTASCIGAGGLNTSSDIHGAEGGGFGTRAGIVITPGNSYKYQVGSGTSTTLGAGDSFFCNSTTNCTSILGSAVQAGGTNGYFGGYGGRTNIGSTTFSGGHGGTGSGTTGGGGGGGAGPGGAGANGTNAAGGTTGGAGGTGGAGSGGVGGTAGAVGHLTGGNGANGVDLGSSHGAGGGGGGSGNTAIYYSGTGGIGGGGAGGGYNPAGGNGICKITPAL